MEESNKSIVLLDTARSQGKTKIIRNVDAYGSDVKDVAFVWYDSSVAVIDLTTDLSIAVYDIDGLISGKGNKGKNKQVEEQKLLVIAVDNGESKVLNIITLNNDVIISSIFLSAVGNTTKAVICYQNGAVCVVMDVLSSIKRIPSVTNKTDVIVTKSVYMQDSNSIYSVYKQASIYFVYIKELQVNGSSVTGGFTVLSFDTDCGIAIPMNEMNQIQTSTQEPPLKKSKAAKGKASKPDGTGEAHFHSDLVVHPGLNCLSVVLTSGDACWWHKLSLQQGHVMFSRNMRRSQVQAHNQLGSMLMCLSEPVCDGGEYSNTVSFAEVHGVGVSVGGDEVHVTVDTYDARYGVSPSALSQTHVFPVVTGNGVSSTLQVLSIVKRSNSSSHSTLSLLFSNVIGNTRVVGKLCCVGPEERATVTSTNATLGSLLGQLHSESGGGRIGSWKANAAAIDCVSVATKSALNSLCNSDNPNAESISVSVELTYEAVTEFYSMFDAVYGGTKTKGMRLGGLVQDKDWDVIRLLVAPTSRPVKSRNGRVHARQNYFSIVQHPAVWKAVLEEQKLDVLLLVCRYCVDISELCAVQTLAYCMGLKLNTDSSNRWVYNTSNRRIEQGVQVQAAPAPAPAPVPTTTPKGKGKSKSKATEVKSALSECDDSHECIPIDDSMFLCALLLETGFLRRPPQHVNSTGNTNSNGCGFNGALLSDALKMTFGAKATENNGGNTAVSVLLFILSKLLKTAVVEGHEKPLRSRKHKASVSGDERDMPVPVVTRSSRDLYVKRIVEWTEAIIDSFLPAFAVLLLSNDTQTSTSTSATLKTAFATLLQCISKVDRCTSSLESTLGVWVHVCRCGGASSSDGRGEMSAELEETKGSGVSSIGGSSSYLYQTESLFL